MPDKYLYKITITPLRGGDGAIQDQEPFSFEVATHENMVGLIDKAQGAALGDAADIPAMIVGLRLLGGVVARKMDNDPYEPLRQGLCQCVKNMQALPGAS